MRKKTNNIVKSGEQKPNRTLKGPEPERLKIEGDWVKAVDKSLAVKRPASGWPK
jgi:hypothetical protein